MKPIENRLHKLKIKQIILTLFFFILSFELFSQNIEFKLFYKDPCNTKTEVALNYFLEKDGIKFNPNFDGIIILKSKGEYNLVRQKEIIKLILDKKRNSHRINLSDKHEFIITHDKHGYEFRNCKGKLNGNIIDYYENGKVRMIGKFKNGLVIGYLTEFYPNGELKEIRLYDKKGYFIEKTLISEWKKLCTTPCIKNCLI